jgi:hypothetical protein
MKISSLSILEKNVHSFLIGTMQLIPWKNMELLVWGFWNSKKLKSWLGFSGKRLGMQRWIRGGEKMIGVLGNKIV